MRRYGKYNAIPTTINGIRFASKREAKRYVELRILEQDGQIHNLETQPSFKIRIDGKPVLIKSKGYPNGRQAKYIADFMYREYQGGDTHDNFWATIIEDAKGMDTPVSKLKRALVEAIYGVEIRLV